MTGKKILTICAICFVIFTQIASAKIEVVKDECPLYISSHMMGSHIIQQNGFYSLSGAILGFSADKFPLKSDFATLTHFIAISRYQPEYISVVLADGTGQNYLGRSDFKLAFNAAGATAPYIIKWSVAFPAEGYYAFNIFADGKLIGYYPFYVWSSKKP